MAISEVRNGSPRPGGGGGGPGDRVRMEADVLDSLLADVRRRHPRKSFGYLLSDLDTHEVRDYILFDENIRNEPVWRPEFESYGDYFVRHPDAGFVATPEEAWKHQKAIWDRGMFEVAVFHSHQRHPANFSRIDYEMHMQRFHTLSHLIISMRNPDQPVVRMFEPSLAGVRELPIWSPSRPAVASLNLAGRGPYPGEEDEDEAEARYQRYVASRMHRIGPVAFLMGTDADLAEHYCAEAPAHEVTLSAFEISEVSVTNELYGLYDPERIHGLPKADLTKPVTNVSWVEASRFAAWVGCRLPTEAEWEYCSGQGPRSECCCSDESDLDNYAWYCKNSEGRVHAVGTRAPNPLGLYDLHGNVWEWCADVFDPDFYHRSPASDPLCRESATTPYSVERVTRGGGMHALPEMCRSRYRFHESMHFRAADLGFRLVHDPGRPWRRV